MKEKKIVANVTGVSSTSVHVTLGHWPRSFSARCRSTDMNCVWQLYALPAHILNISLSFGSEEEICKFQCVSPFDKATNPPTEISQLCSFHNSWQHKSIFTTTALALLVLYSEQSQCGSLQVHLSLSSSSCSVTRVNLCDKFGAITAMHLNQFKPNKTHCHIIQPFHKVNESEYLILIREGLRNARFARPSKCPTFFPLNLSSAFLQNIHFRGFFRPSMCTFNKTKRISLISVW